MRMIGHIPDKALAAVFSDYLYVNGINNQVEQEKERWIVWIHSEDDLEKAKSLLEGFLANPHDPKYRNNAAQASKLKSQEREEQERAAKRYFDRERTFRRGIIFGMGPVTIFLIAASILVTVSYSFNINWPEIEHAIIFSNYFRGAPEVLRGQFWRLITPIFIHANILHGFGVLHILFNALWLQSLGGAVESSLGSRWLFLFTVIVASLSNTAQYLMSGPFFGGLSGVVYALLGFIWIKAKFDPRAHLALHPQTVSMMIIWLFLCLFNVIPNVANTVHVVGLLSGMAWGYLSAHYS